jgi:osmotically inducible protein OsmC
MKRSSTVIWNGSVKEGEGYITTQSHCLEKQPYGLDSRFEDQKGTNPEELIAAAHAACFSMQLSSLLTKAGFVPDIIETTSEVTFENGIISHSHLTVKGRVHHLNEDEFKKYATGAKDTCPVSKALKMSITMDAILTEKIIVNI